MSVAGAALTIETLLTKIKPLAKASEAVQNLAGKIGIGGVTDDRFIARRDEIIKLFQSTGYLPNESKDSTGLLNKNKIAHADIPDRKTNGNYSAEFQRLRQYIVDVLNLKNPGLGTVYGQYFPTIPMVNLGGPDDSFLEALKLVVKSFPPGTYKGGELPMPAKTVTPPYSPVPDYTQSKLAAGSESLSLSDKLGSINGIPIVTIVLMIVGVIVLYTLFKNKS